MIFTYLLFNNAYAFLLITIEKSSFFLKKMVCFFTGSSREYTME